MPRKNFNDIPEAEVSRIFIAGSVKEARRIESLLDAEDIEYALVKETFAGAGLFVALTYDGVAFYVESKHAEKCRTLLRDAGLKKGIMTDDA